MTAPGMTSVSVSLESRRLLNSLRSMSDFKSIDDLIEHLIKEQRMMRLKSEFEDLQKLIAGMESTDIDALIASVELPRNNIFLMHPMMIAISILLEQLQTLWGCKLIFILR